MKREFLRLSLCILLLFSCNTDNESDNGCDIPIALVDCFAPITLSGVRVYFVDKETNKNSFVSGSLILDDIIVTDRANDIIEIELQEIELHESDLPFRSHFLVLYDDFKSGGNEYGFKIKNNIQFDIMLDAIEYTSGCCLGIYLNDLQIQGTDHNLENSINLPIIYIE